MNITAVTPLRPHPEEAALRPSRRMAPCSAVPFAILRDARPKGGLLRRMLMLSACLPGTVTIPWDAKAQFQPELQFFAASLARGESPFWTPNVFAGWPQIADP